MQTVWENFEGFTKKEIATDNISCKSQGMIGYPSERDFKSMASNKIIQNCPIADSDFTKAGAMFGTNLSGTRDKKLRQEMDIMVTDYIAVTRNLLKLHKFATLVADVMFMNNLEFLITISCGIKYGTIEHVTTIDGNYLFSVTLEIWQFSITLLLGYF